jgi:hypothetical protein
MMVWHRLDIDPGVPPHPGISPEGGSDDTVPSGFGVGLLRAPLPLRSSLWSDRLRRPPHPSRSPIGLGSARMTERIFSTDDLPSRKLFPPLFGANANR